MERDEDIRRQAAGDEERRRETKRDGGRRRETAGDEERRRLNVGGLLNIAYTKELLLSAASARQKYHIYLDDQRRLKQDEKKTQKRKGMMEEITQMKAKKKRMEEDIRVLMKSADNNAEKAESQGQLSFISKSNGLRRAAKEKERHLETLERQLTDKLKELRDTP
ncbi:Pre-rRNA-processing protein TSR1 like [Dissostichus eleginoides]|uniref:Pre-rRNA-processing protein TSR1 like n=1 Tax=Dissostichus eleginoides TaxID=100907 RepID=A0AAD9CHM4_DISEL|nr:Pre-rRNA-processing protein TSR1 like [Dissostichus eleginoides]